MKAITTAIMVVDEVGAVDVLIRTWLEVGVGEVGAGGAEDDTISMVEVDDPFIVVVVE